MSRKKGTIRFIKKFYLEIIALILFLTASIILGFYIDFWDFVLAEFIIIVVMGLILFLLRKIVGRVPDRNAKSVSRAEYAKLTTETIHSRLAKGGDLGYQMPGHAGPYGSGSSSRPMITMHEMEYGDQTNGKTLFGQVNIPRNEIGLEELKQSLVKEHQESPSPEIEQQLKEMQKYDTKIKDIEGQNIKVFDDEWGFSYSFVFPKNSTYSLFLGSTLEQNQKGKIIVEGILKKFQPFSLSIHKLENEKEKYSIILNSFLKGESIHQQEDIQKLLNEIYPSVEHLIFDEKYFAAIIQDLDDLKFVFEIAKKIYRELIKHEFEQVEVDRIKCYKCGTKLSPKEEKCSNCGSTRPTCKVCLLNLFPSEKEEVIQTPCCGAYAHKFHMIMWLEKTQKCPNCQKRQIKWLDQLKK